MLGAVGGNGPQVQGSGTAWEKCSPAMRASHRTGNWGLLVLRPGGTGGRCYATRTLTVLFSTPLPTAAVTQRCTDCAAGRQVPVR